MNKKLIAAAVASVIAGPAAISVANADVSVYGTVHVRAQLTDSQLSLVSGSQTRFGFKLPGQMDAKRTPLTEFTLQGDLTSQQTAQFADNRQSQPGPRMLAGHGICSRHGAGPLPELLKNQGLIFFADANPRIGDSQLHIAARMAVDRYVNSPPLGRELDRIGQQVIKNLLHLGLILKHGRKIRRNRMDQVDVFLFGKGSRHVTLGSHDRPNPKLAGLHIHLAVFHLGEIQDVIDHVQENSP